MNAIPDLFQRPQRSARREGRAPRRGFPWPLRLPVAPLGMTTAW